MKILFVNYAHFITGGSERYLFNIVEKVKEHGHEIIHFSMTSNDNYECTEKEYFASPINTTGNFFFEKNADLKSKIKNISRLFYSREVESKLDKLIKDKKPDVAYILHFHKKLSPAVIVACKKNNLPVFVRLSDYIIMCPKVTFYYNKNICEDCKKSKFYSVRKKCIKGSYIASLLWYLADKYHHYKKFYDYIDSFVVTNPFMKSKLIEYGYKNEINIINTFAPSSKKLRMTYEEKIEIKQLVYIGTIYKDIKGVELIFEAFKVLRSKGINFKLKIIGRDLDNIIRDNYQDIIKHEDVEYIEHIEHSNKDKILNIFAESLYFLNPVIIYENFPNTILESFSVGTPVISTDIGSIKTMIDHGKTGFLINYNSVEGLVETIEKALKLSSEEYMLMQDNCINKIETEWDSETHYRKLVNMFEKGIK